MIPVKVCKKHGPLRPDGVKILRKSDRKNLVMLCILCTRENNCKTKRKWAQKHDKGYLLSMYKAKSQKMRDTLSDGYLRDRLVRDGKLKRCDITPEMIELKRASLLLKRKIIERQRSK